MNINDIYQRFIQLGIEHDPREKAEIEAILEKAKEDEKLIDEEKKTNPYSDTRVLYGDDDKSIQKVIVGIDVETQELLLVDRLNERGEGIDLVIAHHPEGQALLALNEVMNIQETMLENTGVPIAMAQGILSSRVSAVKRSLMPLNAQRVVDTAKLLDLPMMCVHTPADNQVQYYLEDLMKEKVPKTVGDVIKVLEEIPEYVYGKSIGAGPTLISGSKDRKTGKILIDMTGGTSGSEKIYEKLAAAGVGTIVGMHMGEAHRKEAEKHFINVIIAGHMASDSLGMNLLMDELEQAGIEVKAFSGFHRVKRNGQQ